MDVPMDPQETHPCERMVCGPSLIARRIGGLLGSMLRLLSPVSFTCLAPDLNNVCPERGRFVQRVCANGSSEEN